MLNLRHSEFRDSGKCALAGVAHQVGEHYTGIISIGQLVRAVVQISPENLTAIQTTLREADAAQEQTITSPVVDDRGAVESVRQKFGCFTPREGEERAWLDRNWGRDSSRHILCDHLAAGCKTLSL